MKKSLSIMFCALMLFSCVFGNITTYANTKKTAQTIEFNQSVNAYVDASSKEYWIKFEPTSTGYYEFVCSTLSPYGTVIATIYDSAKEALMVNSCDSTSTDFITATYLTAGETYYFVLETENIAYSTAVTVKAHSHTFNTVLNYPAIYDQYESDNCENGGNYTFCAYCDEYITNAVYYIPKNITLKKSTFVYNGKAKTTTVTAYDQMGNVIPASNYTVKYKNNTKPGNATVTVTFNNVNYSGSFTANITIKPKKESITYLGTKSAKSLLVKWKKDTTVTGYQVQYSTSKKFYKSKTKTVTITSKKTIKKTISKLKSNKKYYVRVRSYKTSNGKKIYGDWSAVKSVKVK